jgi:hypothetical protein
MGLWPTKSRIGKGFAIGGAVLVALVVAGVILLHHFWPFTEEAVKRELADAASAKVSFEKFHDSYFPPGCVAEGAVFHRNASGEPFITIRRLTIRSNFFDLLHHHIALIRADGAHVTWQKAENRADPPSQPTVVDRLVADDAVLEIPRKSADGPLRFVFHKFEVKNLQGQGQSSFAADLENPLPHGNLNVSGHFGPWNNSAPKKTALDGNYDLDRADLGVFHSVGGLVSSKGQFSGPFENLDVQGKTSTPQLSVTSTHHGLPLKTDFVAKINGATADVILPRVKAQFGKDELDLHGSIARDKSGKRVANFEIECDRGRIEDTFYPFIHSSKAALTGDVRFRMHVTIPPGKEKFDEKIGLTSTFDIANARFTHEKTQMDLSKVAEAPNQKRPDPLAPASLRGHVVVEEGTAHFSQLRITDQDASADFHGTFGLVDERVNLHGNLKTAASLTKTTHGIKAVFAKVLEPFFKKRPHETVIPVKIGGTYGHPQFGLDLSKKM